jgi:hypothetical protein
MELVRQRIHQFERKISDVHQAAQAKRTFLENPGFERKAQEREDLPGWDVPAKNAVFWSLDRQNPRSGNKSLMLASTRESGAVLSSSLPALDCRFLTMSVWLRSNRDAADVRLAFEATLDGRRHVESRNVEVDTRWRRYELQVNDIPDRALENAKVTVEMRDPGKVWIDDVDVQMHRLTPDDLRQLTKVYSAVTLAWDEKRYADCQRLLASYWGQLLFDEGDANLQEARGRTLIQRRLPRLFRR